MLYELRPCFNFVLNVEYININIMNKSGLNK